MFTVDVKQQYNNNMKFLIPKGWLVGWSVGWLVGWLVGCFGFNGPLRQYFSLYQAVSQREGEREEKR